jgi:hypothetical protein
MLRRFIIAVATVAALGIGATDASAAWHGHGGGWHGGGWHGGGYRGGYYGGGWGWGIGPGLLAGALIGGALASPYYYGYGPYYYGGCYRNVHVHTRYGWHWRRVWVCE